jgi:TRAP-type C4-dicarboxylate transport system substrate-binding protein
MTGRYRCLALLALLALLSAVASAEARARELIKLGTLAPEGSPWHEALREIGERWAALSGGEIEVRIYAGGVSGDEDDTIRKMRVGQLQAAALSSGGLSDLVPDFRAYLLPMVFANYEELDHVLALKRPALDAALEAKGYKVVAWGDAGFVHFFTQKPVVRPDDLKPQRLFWWESGGAYTEAWKEAGFQPVPLSATELHTALQSGLINAFAAPPLAALSFQWFPLAPHMTRLNWTPLLGITVVKLEVWNRLPQELRPQLLKAAEEAGQRQKGAIRNLAEKAVAVMQQHGLTVHEVTPEAMREWEESARAAYPKLIGPSVPPAAAEEVIRLRDEFRKKSAL